MSLVLGGSGEDAFSAGEHPSLRIRVTLTDRDRTMLRWIGRHGVVTTQQIARRFFMHDGAIAERAAYRRVAILEGVHLVRRDPPSAGHAGVVRLRTAGSRIVGGDVEVLPRYEEREIPHALAVVDVVDAAATAFPQASVRTAREVRHDRAGAIADGTRQVGTGRAPDAVLTFPDGKALWIEVGITALRQREYRSILDAYRKERFDRLWWYVPAVAVERVLALVHQERLDDVIEVRTGPGPDTVHPVVALSDVEILTWIGRHGLVTGAQIARRFFTREDGRLGVHATARRLRRLEDEEFVRRKRPPGGQFPVYRLTTAGAAVADAGIRPAGWVAAEIPHALAVVDLMESLMSDHSGSTMRTEREVRTQRGRDAGGRPPGDRRIPDGELILPDGRVVAVELDLTAKRSQQVEEIVRLYLHDSYAAVWWFVRPGTVDRMREAVRSCDATRLIEIHPWTKRGSDV